MKKEYFYYLLITLAFVIMATFNACKPKPEPEPNTPGSVSVTTSSVSNITETSAKCGGTVTASGYSVGNCGLCYSELPNPTINSYITSDQMGTGTFTSTMSGLEPGTKYYVRAYATTSSGTLYGEQKEFTTLGDNNGGDDDDDDDEPSIPSVITNSISNYTHNSATCGGNVTNDGGATITQKGVCWSTSQNPTINNNKTIDGNGIGGYVSNITGLNESTTYYVRAYAVNNAGVGYGSQISFTTETKPTTGTINGHEWVDLGLPSGLKWATCNVGASSPEDYGNYYAWGETTTSSCYHISQCSLYYVSINDISGNPQYDAATANWGGSWRMPTKTELEELLKNCIWMFTEQDNVKGCKVISKTNNNYIFLPAAGEILAYDHYYNNVGIYWSSTPCNILKDEHSEFLSFDIDGEGIGYNWVSYDRLYGRSIRPVSD